MGTLKNLIPDKSKNDFEKVLKKFRSQSKSALSFDEITKEVEFVREKRYVK